MEQSVCINYCYLETIGKLLICGIFVNNNLEVCIVREIRPQTGDSERTPLLNEYNCPLLMTGSLCVLSTSKIDKYVSIVHVCSEWIQLTLNLNIICLITCIGNN